MALNMFTNAAFKCIDFQTQCPAHLIKLSLNKNSFSKSHSPLLPFPQVVLQLYIWFSVVLKTGQPLPRSETGYDLLPPVRLFISCLLSASDIYKMQDVDRATDTETLLTGPVKSWLQLLPLAFDMPADLLVQPKWCVQLLFKCFSPVGSFHVLAQFRDIQPRQLREGIN